METSRTRSNIFDPLHLSGLVAVFMLVLPGTISGLLRLLTYAGFAAPGAVIPSQTHAFVQLFGFFVILIWGFLTNSMPGLVGVAPWLKYIRWPIGATALGLSLLLASSFQLEGLENWGYAFLFAGAVSATGMSLVAAVLGGRSVLERPNLLLLAGLISPPFAVVAAWAGLPDGAPLKLPSDLVLYGCVIPVILAMGYRMFSSLGGLRFSRQLLFDLASVFWVVGLCLLALSAWVPSIDRFADAALFVTWVTFGVALGAFERSRRNRVHDKDPVERAVGWHIRAAFVFLVLGSGLNLPADFGLFDASYYLDDVARHLVAVGFALLVVMAVTQRMYPALVRGTRSSGPWMQVNGILVTVGISMRLFEIGLPQTQLVVALGGFLTTAGIIGYGIHMLRGILVRSNTRLQPVQPIRMKRIKTQAERGDVRQDVASA